MIVSQQLKPYLPINVAQGYNLPHLPYPDTAATPGAVSLLCWYVKHFYEFKFLSWALKTPFDRISQPELVCTCKLLTALGLGVLRASECVQSSLQLLPVIVLLPPACPKTFEVSKGCTLLVDHPRYSP